MSKLSFRARALDPSKPMPIYLAEELPDLPEYSAINRAVPQMPSGMEKEEEAEHHLQRAMVAKLIIPTPEVFETEREFYERNYPPSYKMPRQLIHMQPLNLEQDIPDYDMDSADEMWINSQSKRLDLTWLKFEQMMDRLEKSSGQTVVTLNEAKALLKQDDEVSIAVYDYWLTKRLKTQHPLILNVKTENRGGIAANSPYLAFRRRTEKMQTRKNRKNDETSYEKMLKLRRDLSRAVTLLEMIKKREKTKREQLHLSVEVFEKRYQSRDFSGQLLAEYTSQAAKNTRPAFTPLYPSQYSITASSGSGRVGMAGSPQPSQWASNSGNGNGSNAVTISGGYHANQYGVTKRDLDSMNGGSIGASRKEKRQYKKRKHKQQREKRGLYASPGPVVESSMVSSEDEEQAFNMQAAECEDEGLYVFKRNRHCLYNNPQRNGYGNWPWASKEENGSADPRYRFTLTSLAHPRRRCIGFARRRIGRGGRVIIDRVSTDMDDLWSRLDYTILDSGSSAATPTIEYDSPTKRLLDIKLEVEDDRSMDVGYSSSRGGGDGVASRRGSSSTIYRPNRTISNSCNNHNAIPSLGEEDVPGVLGISVTVSGNNVAISDGGGTTEAHGDNTMSPKDEDGRRNVIKSENSNSNINNDNALSKVLDDNSNHNNNNSNSSSNIIVHNNRLGVSSSSDTNNCEGASSTANRRFPDSRQLTGAVASEHLDPSRMLLQSTKAAATSKPGLIDLGRSLSMPPNVFLDVVTAAPYDGQMGNVASDQKNWDSISVDNEEDMSLADLVRTSTSRQQGGASTKEGGAALETSSTSEEAYFKEIRQTFLHFRPKTPPMICATNQVDEKAVRIPPSAPLQLRLATIATATAQSATDRSFVTNEDAELPSSIFINSEDNLFHPQSFALDDILDSSYSSCSTANSILDGDDLLASPCPNKAADLSGDSLNELSLNLGDTMEDNEKVLENILQECEMSDLKILEDPSLFTGLSSTSLDGHQIKEEEEPIVSLNIFQKAVGYQSELATTPLCSCTYHDGCGDGLRKVAAGGIRTGNHKKRFRRAHRLVGRSRFQLSRSIATDETFSKKENGSDAPPQDGVRSDTDTMTTNPDLALPPAVVVGSGQAPPMMTIIKEEPIEPVMMCSDENVIHLQQIKFEKHEEVSDDAAMNTMEEGTSCGRLINVVSQQQPQQPTAGAMRSRNIILQSSNYLAQGPENTIILTSSPAAKSHLNNGPPTEKTMLTTSYQKQTATTVLLNRKLAANQKSMGDGDIILSTNSSTGVLNNVSSSAALNSSGPGQQQQQQQVHQTALVNANAALANHKYCFTTSAANVNSGTIVNSGSGIVQQKQHPISLIGTTGTAATSQGNKFYINSANLINVSQQQQQQTTTGGGGGGSNKPLQEFLATTSTNPNKSFQYAITTAPANIKFNLLANSSCPAGGQSVTHHHQQQQQELKNILASSQSIIINDHSGNKITVPATAGALTTALLANASGGGGNGGSGVVGQQHQQQIRTVTGISGGSGSGGGEKRYLYTNNRGQFVTAPFNSKMVNILPVQQQQQQNSNSSSTTNNASAMVVNSDGTATTSGKLNNSNSKIITTTLNSSNNNNGSNSNLANSKGPPHLHSQQQQQQQRLASLQQLQAIQRHNALVQQQQQQQQHHQLQNSNSNEIRTINRIVIQSGGGGGVGAVVSTAGTNVVTSGGAVDGTAGGGRNNGSGGGNAGANPNSNAAVSNINVNAINR